MEQKPGKQQKERIAKFNHGNEILESNFKENKGRLDKKY